jgi:hypothetical protein
MPVEFACAQARAQAQHGARLTADAWSLLGSSVGLAQFLHQLRVTSLAPRVENISSTTSPHVIERSLRREWRDEVDSAVRWVPARWRPAVAWTAGLADLPSISHLLHGGEVHPWMAGDDALSAFAVDEPLDAIEAAGYSDGLDTWLRQWRGLWPERAEALEELLSLAESHAIRRDSTATEDWRGSLERRAVRMLRWRREQPVTVFCHLLLCALELHRLRQGLLQRALFNDLETEPSA